MALPALVASATEIPLRLPESEAKVQVLLSLPLYINWPDSSGMGNPHSPFLIGLLGPSALHDPLLDLSQSKTIRGKRVAIKYSPRVQDLADCHVIFLRDRDAERLPEILHALRGRSILTVGDTEHFCQEGVMVNLYLHQKRIAMEMNLKMLRSQGLNASSHLLKLVRIVE